MSRPLRRALLELPVSERLELVQDLWDSIAADCERHPLPLSDEQRLDLERRLAEADETPVGGSSWGDVRDRISSSRG